MIDFHDTTTTAGDAQQMSREVYSRHHEEILSRLDRIEAYAAISAKKILTIDEAAMLIGRSKKYVYRLTSERSIPHCKQGRSLYFKKDELERWMTGQKIATDDRMNKAATTRVALNSTSVIP